MKIDSDVEQLTKNNVFFLTVSQNEFGTVPHIKIILF